MKAKDYVAEIFDTDFTILIGSSDLEGNLIDFARIKVKEENQKCIDSIHQILGKYGNDREDIKQDFRNLTKHLKTLY